MHLADGRATADALVAQVGWADPMGLEQKRLKITQATGRGHLGPVASSAQAPQQAGLRTSLQGDIQGEGSGALQIPTKTAAGEQQGHAEVVGAVQPTLPAAFRFGG